MARAKRTERAEARRRYRATLATDPLVEDADGADGVATSGSSKDAKRSNAASSGKQGTSGTPERVGFLDAFRQSIRPVHVREDIASLPWIATHTKAIWLPALITVAATIATAATGATDMVTGLLFTYFVVFPAIGGVFIGGFLAPRASWLVGVVIGLISAACYVALGVTGKLPAPFAEQYTVSAAGAAISAFIYSPIMGAFFAAAAAWYRRFLNRANPNRARPSTPTSRRPDGKVPKKPQQRPMLARRR